MKPRSDVALAFLTGMAAEDALGRDGSVWSGLSLAVFLLAAAPYVRALRHEARRR